MNKPLVLLAAATVALCLAVGSAWPDSQAQGKGSAVPVPLAARPKGHYAALEALPDWGGVWVLDRPAAAPPEKPALKGKYLDDYHAWQHDVQTKGGVVAHEGSYCTPPGMPMILGVGQYPIEFLFTPGRVTTHFEAWMQWRNIYTDGRGHPDDLDPTFYGDSIGHWEGGTLVVDTVAIKDSLGLSMGMKHSDKMRIKERIHLDKGNPDVLLDELTVEDPVALEKPWVQTLTWKRSRELQLLEFECAENDRNPVDSNGNTGFKRE